MKFNYIKILLIGTLLPIIFICNSFGNGVKFYHLNTSNGLSQNTIYFIHQDKEGFFWFGTNGGLNKWNGYNFDTYVHSQTDPNSIGQGRVTSILEEDDGTLWIGTLQGGISKYNKTRNNFDNFNLFQNKDSANQGNNIIQIVKYNGYLIIGTFGNGLYYLNKQTKKFIPIKVQTKNSHSLNHLLTNKLFIDVDSTLWIGHNQGVIKITKQIFNDDNPSLKGVEILKGENILSIYRDSHNQVWFGTHNSGAIILDLKTNKHTNLGTIESIKPIYYSIIRDFCEDKNGNLWIATGGNGLIIIDSTKTLIKHYKSELNNAYSLSSNITYKLYLDNNENIWVGTYNGGLNYTNNHKQSFNHIRGFGGENELTNNAILSICELDNGNIMLGTDGDGISIFNSKKSSIKPLSVFNDHDKARKSVPVCMANDKKGNIYIGTYLKGLYVYNQQTNKIKNYRAGSGEFDLPNNNIWSIAIGNNNEVWLGTLEDGFVKFNPNSEKFYGYKTLAHFDIANEILYVFTILVDSKNNVWFGTQNHGILFLPNKKDGIVKNYSKNGPSGLTSNEILKIYEDSQHNIWVGTHDGGLCKLNNKTETFEVITTENGLLSNTIRSIIEDKNGNIWVGSNLGLSCLSFLENELNIKNFTLQNGLQGNEFNTNAAIITDDGKLYLGGNSGFNYFNPEEIIASEDVGPIMITNILALYHNDISGKSTSIIDTKDENKTINLKYNISLITIEYALLDYTIPELNKYQYKLEGFDNNWIDAGNKRIVTYTNLDPGNYEFKVKGTNSLGIENPKIKTIAFIIHPPFWKRLWFLIGLGLIISLAVIFIYWLREKSFRDQEKLLKEKVDSRTKDLLDLNRVLAGKNNEINLQSEELKTKSEHLIEVNTNLEESYQQIENQNTELEKHRNNLETLVKERTKELEKAKLKAEESEQLKMAFLSNMSHEIRTPMNAIIGFSSLLTQTGFSLDERKTFTNLINSNSQSLLFLIDDILDLSRIEGNQLIISKQKFNFIELINEIFASWKVISNTDYSNVNFELINSIADKNIEVISDDIRIKQIINNLIDNAFKFTSKGSVAIKLWIEDSNIITYVKDTGIGIGADSLAVVFDRFRKSEDSKDKKYRGAGLGLTISKKLAHMLGGELWANSEIGSGSEFYLQIPLNRNK